MAAYRELEVTLLSARDLKSVNLITRMDVYAVASISGDPLTRQCTPADHHGGSHPTWNATLRFSVPPTASAAAGRCLHVLLRAERVLGDRDVGEVVVPLPDLFLAAAGVDDSPGLHPEAAPRLASYYVYKVHRPGEPRGVLSMSYRLGPVVAPVGKPENAPPSGIATGYAVTTADGAYRPRGGERADKQAPSRAMPARSGSEVSHRAQPPPPPPPMPPTQIFLGFDAHTQISVSENNSPRMTSAPKAGFSQHDDKQVRAYLPAVNKPNTNPEKTDHHSVSKPIPQQQNTRAYGHTQPNTNNNPQKIDNTGHKSTPPQQDTTRAGSYGHNQFNNNNSGNIDTSGYKASFPQQDTTRPGSYGHSQSNSNNNNNNSGKIDTSSGHNKAASFPRQDTTRAGAHPPAHQSNNLGKTDSFVRNAFPRHDTQGGGTYYAPPSSRSNISQRMPDRHQQGPKDHFVQQDKHVGAYAY